MRIVCLAVVLAATPALADSGDSTIVASIAQCESGAPDACLDAATAMEQVHAASRLGKTPRDLRELARQAWEKQCQANDGDACLEHGKLLARAGDKAGTAEIERGCTIGSGRACLYLAEHEKTPAKALALLEQACDHGEAHACTEIAQKDHARASELYRKACDGNDVLGCSHSGVDRRTAGDTTGAFADFLKACDGEIFDSCVSAGELAPDPAKARELFTRACDANTSAGCSHLADLVAHGQGGDRNWGQGLDLAEKACTLAHASHCPQLADLRAHPPDATCSTDDTCQKLCDERLGAACRTEGELRERELEGSGLEAFADACKYGDAEACLYAGNDSTLADATGSYERGCKLGNKDACLYAEVAHGSLGSAAARESLRRRCGKTPATCTLYGIALAGTDPARALKVWKVACAKGDGAACRAAAMQLAPNGSYGVCDCEDMPKTKAERELEADQAESEKLWKRGCDLGDTKACAEEGPYDAKLPPRPLTTPVWR
jgi:TPR repeat protein